MSSSNILRLLRDALALNQERLDLVSGNVLKVRPNTDDVGAINIGDGTYDIDVKIFLGSTTEYIEFDVGNSRLNVEVPVVFGSNGGPKYRVQNKTADYTVTEADFGSIFTNRGDADAIEYTLPAASGNEGAWVEFWSVANQNLTVSGQDEELVVLNDLTADSISFQTTNEKIGGAFRAVCDGSSWLVSPIATETQTVTITSA